MREKGQTTTATHHHLCPCSDVQTIDGSALIRGLRERESEIEEEEEERVEAKIQCSNTWLFFFFDIHSDPWLKREKERGQLKREEEENGRGQKIERERES